MKKYLFLFFLIISNSLLFGQNSIAEKKPKYVIIAGDKIVTKEKVDELAKQGYVKGIMKGVSDEERSKLLEKFGEQIGGKEFIVLVSLFSEKEKQENEIKRTKNVLIKNESPIAKDYLLDKNDTAKDFSLQMIDGTSIRLSDLKGKVVLINFWATWCAPCIMEFYDFPSKIINKYKENDFVLLAVSIGEDQKKVKSKMESLKKDGIDFNVGIDPDKIIWNNYAKGSIPKNFLIDKNGIIRYVSTGNIENGLDKISSMIKNLLND